MQYLVELNDRQKYVLDVALAVLTTVMPETNNMLTENSLELRGDRPPDPAGIEVTNEDISNLRRALWLD